MRRLLTMLPLAVAMLIASCTYSPVEMVDDYNNKFSYPDRPQEPGKEYELPSLLQYTSYYIRPHSYLDFEVNSGYVEYEWTLTGADGKKYDIGHAYWTAHINTNELRMDEGVYTLRLRVKNRLGIYYHDTAKVFVEDY